MTFNVEVLLRGREDVVELNGPDSAFWTDDNVRAVLRLTLGVFAKVQNPSVEEQIISLRGMSWIVVPVERGVLIAVEIPSGAVVARPFDTDAERLTKIITRVLATPSSSDQVH